MWSCVFRCQARHLPKKICNLVEHAAPARATPMVRRNLDSQPALHSPDAPGAWTENRFRWEVEVRVVGSSSPSQWTARTPRQPELARAGSRHASQRQQHCTGSNARRCSTMPRCARSMCVPCGQTHRWRLLHGNGQAPLPLGRQVACRGPQRGQTTHAPMRCPDTTGRPRAHT